MYYGGGGGGWNAYLHFGNTVWFTNLLQYLFYDVNGEMLVKVLNGGLVFQLLIIDGNDGNINIIIAFL